MGVRTRTSYQKGVKRPGQSPGRKKGTKLKATLAREKAEALALKVAEKQMALAEAAGLVMEDAIVWAVQQIGHDDEGTGGLSGYLLKRAREAPDHFDRVFLGPMVKRHIEVEHRDATLEEIVAASFWLSRGAIDGSGEALPVLEEVVGALARAEGGEAVDDLRGKLLVLGDRDRELLERAISACLEERAALTVSPAPAGGSMAAIEMTPEQEDGDGHDG